jgi:hypothetical protein
MAVYNFYRLMAGQAVSTAEVACPDDASARLTVAKTLAPQETAEVWQGIRHVAKITGTDCFAPCMRKRTG